MEVLTVNRRRFPDRHRRQFGLDPAEEEPDIEPDDNSASEYDASGDPTVDWVDRSETHGQVYDVTSGVRISNKQNLYVHAGIVRQAGTSVRLGLQDSPPALIVQAADQDDPEAFTISPKTETSGGGIGAKAVILRLLELGFSVRTTYDAEWNEEQGWWEVRLT